MVFILHSNGVFAAYDVFAMLNIGKPENTNNRKYLLIIPAAVLVLLVMTNDFISLLLYLNPISQLEQTIQLRSCLLCNCSVDFYTCTFVNCAFNKSMQNFRNTQKLWIPIVIILVAIIYTLWNNLNHGYSGLRIYNVPEVFCFASIALWESLIQIGLVPSNTGYGDFSMRQILTLSYLTMRAM